MKMMNWNSATMMRNSLLTACVAMLLTGCSGLKQTVSSGPVTIAGPALKGSVYGGRQPIGGATLYMYAASTTGYVAASTPLLTSSVQSDASGNFHLTSKYTCTAGQQVYLVAIGGNPGSGVNAQSGIMAALGDCSSLTSSTFISMNEVTTVAATFALAPFMSSYTNVGTSAGNSGGLVRAFASINKLANLSNGTSPGPALPAGASVSSSEIYTLADVLAACINSTGGVSGDGSICGTLFNLAKPVGGTAATDTIGLALAIAKNPTQNVESMFDYATPQSPYAPRLAQVPADWTISINYTGFKAPKSTTIDGNGNVWVANSGNNSVTLLSQTGAATYSGNGLSAPSAVAIDSGGNAWVTNSGGSTVSGFTNSGNALNGSPFSVGTAPSAIAFDSAGQGWVTNAGSSSVTEISNTGSTLQTVSAGISAPVAVAIDPQ